MIEKSIFKDGANKNLTHPKGSKGITLVALIITIIVLLILAVVAIGAVNNTGIIQYAQNSADEYKDGRDEENTTLGNYVDILNYYKLTDEPEEILWEGYGNIDEKGYELYYLGTEKEITLNFDTIKANVDIVDENFEPTGTISLETIKLNEIVGGELNLGENVETLNLGPKVMNLESVLNKELYVFWQGNVTTITFLEGVTEIPSDFCSECSKLLTVNLPDSLKIIRSSAFSRCSGLTELTIPESVTLIESFALDRCTNLMTINFGGTMATWNSFGITGLTAGAQIICSDGTITVS